MPWFAIMAFTSTKPKAGRVQTSTKHRIVSLRFDESQIFIFAFIKIINLEGKLDRIANIRFDKDLFRISESIESEL